MTDARTPQRHAEHEAITLPYDALDEIARRLASFRRDDLTEIAGELLTIRRSLRQAASQDLTESAAMTSDQLFRKLHEQINYISAAEAEDATPDKRAGYSRDIERMLKLRTKVKAIGREVDRQRTKRTEAADEGDDWVPDTSDTTLADVYNVLMIIAEHQRTQSDALGSIAANYERASRAS